MLALIALRVTIGLHFSVEGINKFVDPKPFSAGFLLASKGPFGPLFQSMVWDSDGVARLDTKATSEIWEKYRQRAIRHFGLDEKAAKQAEAIRKNHENQLAWHFEGNHDDLLEYREGLKRRDRYRVDDVHVELASLRGQLDSIEQELSSKRGKLLKPVDAIWASYQREINALGAAAGHRGVLTLPKAGRKLLDSEMIDVIIR